MRRELTINVKHSRLIWSVISFQADIVNWDFETNPSRGVQRHVIKSLSGYGLEEWSLSLSIQLTKEEFEAAQRQSQRAKGQRGDTSEEDERLGMLEIHFSAIDRERMWPASQSEDKTHMGLSILKKLDESTPEQIDHSLFCVVGGVVKI
jgi:hypothetical protein